MILSVSRRTDIPNYYSEWFLNRIKEGYLYVRNPMNTHQISKIKITPELVDCIVFWTKNPKPMMDKLDELKDYFYYFQFTLTGYGKDVEPNLPHKREKMIPIFQELSRKLGKEKVIWRYDPIMITDQYTVEYHMQAFREIAESLNGYTDKVIISFLDCYAKTKKNMKEIHIKTVDDKKLGELATELTNLAKANSMEIEACAEQMDLSIYGIKHGSCIDKGLLERITGYEIRAGKDRNQRKECGCVESVEVGTYHTCPNGCRYCYANDSYDKVKKNRLQYDAASPLLCGKVEQEDKITERKVKSLKENQLRFKI
jgi:peroxiredoxin family protein